VSGTTLDDNLLKTGLKGGEELGLSDFYTAHLWNYCSGNITTEGSKDTWKVTECAKPKTTFHFDVYAIFKLDSDASGKSGVTEDDIPSAVQKVNKAIKVVSNIMVALYCLGLVALVVTFVVGWFGLLSRWGSCVTTIFADVSLLIPQACFVYPNIDLDRLHSSSSCLPQLWPQLCMRPSRKASTRASRTSGLLPP